MPAIARDVQLGDLVLASNGIKKRKYVCLCPDAHAVCLKQGTERAVHFAHIPVRGPDGDFIPSCRSGGESEEHIKAKLKLVEQRGDYSFCLKTCKVCKKKVMEDCRNGTMKIEAWSGDKRWKYDVLYTRSDGSKLALEVYHTHATGENKVLSSTAAGIPIAEFDAGDILRMKEGTILDNKLDTSWVCSAMCQGLKQQRDHLLEMAARRKVLQNQRMIEAFNRRVQMREMEARRKVLQNQRMIAAFNRRVQMREMGAKRHAKMHEDLLKEQAAAMTVKLAEDRKIAAIQEACLETRTGRNCIIFKMRADANNQACGFCSTSYAGDHERWDAFQCWNPSAPPQCVNADLFLVCSDCRMKEAAYWINDNNNDHLKIFLENASNTTLYRVDSFVDYNY